MAARGGADVNRTLKPSAVSLKANLKRTEVAALRKKVTPASAASTMLAFAFLAVLAGSLAACGPKNSDLPPGTTRPDQFLYDRGMQSLNEKKWLKAREYFREIYDNYPQSSLRPEAKLGIGDSLLGEGSAEALVLAANEYNEFLTFFPTHARADYAQYKLGMTHFEEMLGPDRDQTQTRQAIAEFETFVERFPNSKLMPDVQARLRESRDRLSESNYRVGYFYFRTARWYPGAIDRFRSVLENDPGYTNRDAVYFYLAESLLSVDRAAEALPYYERLIKEFEKSEYLEKANERIESLKKLMAKRN
ncbi:MAG: outer membrane protein assembly factor BamD [Acidobacteria bacterium]|nr:MAG: outer membrane protein assembly factor BamD [Acidobacteriota bacterium]